jgi:predicted Zn-ribbon and HTH transcriptional regulator
MQMQLSASLPSRLRRGRHDGRPRHNPAVLKTLARAKRSGGPEDHALYSCHCGYAFKAEVSTSVGCPHCGSSQAW